MMTEIDELRTSNTVLLEELTKTDSNMSDLEMLKLRLDLLTAWLFFEDAAAYYRFEKYYEENLNALLRKRLDHGL